MRCGVPQLHRWGLLDRVVDAGRRRSAAPRSRYADEVVVITIKPSYGVDALYAPRRTVLDPILVDAAGRAGVDVLFGITVTDVVRDRLRGGRRASSPAVPTDPRSGFTHRSSSAPTASDPRSPSSSAPGSSGSAPPPARSPTATGPTSTPMDTSGCSVPTRRPVSSRPTAALHVCSPAPRPPASVAVGSTCSVPCWPPAHPISPNASPVQPLPPGTRTFAGRPGHVRQSWGDRGARQATPGTSRIPSAPTGSPTR